MLVELFLSHLSETDFATQEISVPSYFILHTMIIVSPLTYLCSVHF